MNDSSKIKQKYVNKFKALLYMLEQQKKPPSYIVDTAAAAAATTTTNHLTIQHKYCTIYIVQLEQIKSTEKNLTFFNALFSVVLNFKSIIMGVYLNFWLLERPLDPNLLNVNEIGAYKYTHIHRFAYTLDQTHTHTRARIVFHPVIVLIPLLAIHFSHTNN